MTQFSRLFSHPLFPIWRLRLLLAVALLFGSEVLLWTAPVERSLLDWLPLILGYTAVATLLLDLAARFRVRNIFGLLALAGIYGLLNGLLLNPETALIDVPRTLFTRVLGAHTLMGFLMLLLWLRLLTPKKTPFVIAVIVGVVIGIGWGVWAHWSPTLLNLNADETPLAVMLVAALVSAGIFALLLALPRHGQLVDAQLKPQAAIILIILLVGLLVIRVVSGQVDNVAFSSGLLLIIFCGLVLWFQRRKKGRTLLDDLDTQPVRWSLLLVLLVTFVAAGIASYGLPRGEGSGDPVFIVTIVLTAFGVAWLPGASLAMGATAFARQVRAGKL